MTLSITLPDAACTHRLMAETIFLPGTGKGPGTNIHDVSCSFTLLPSALSCLPCGGGGIACSLRHKLLRGIQLEMWEKAECSAQQ